MSAFPIDYIEPVFRPPSEHNALILPVTNGCSWNQCTFCEMYTQPQKKFRARKAETVVAEIQAASQQVEGVEKVFLADGDAMILPTHRLVEILQALQSAFPGLKRVSAYCLPRNLKRKTWQELQTLRELGLKMLYVGCESGDDQVLEAVNKGETYQSQLEALDKIHRAGIKSSVMILNGLGGIALSQQHAVQSAQLVNEAQPNFLSTLVVSFPLGQDRFSERYQAIAGQPYELPSQQALFEEIALFLSQTDLKQTIFRSDHASNYLVLKGVLGKDKPRLLQQVRTAIEQPGRIALRQEWQRGL
ncbi:MAG: radical SAM protein [Pseudomonadota bacterium]|nr:radical SAM protein [Pseudomonadota bacterium]